MSAGIDFLVLSKGNFRMVVSDGELSPIKLAVETLQRDFKSVMGFCPPIVSTSTDGEKELIELIIINESIVDSSMNKSELVLWTALNLIVYMQRPHPGGFI